MCRGLGKIHCIKPKSELTAHKTQTDRQMKCLKSLYTANLEFGPKGCDL